MALIITDATLEDVLIQKEITIIDFWASWCNPCVALGPIIDELGADNTNKNVIVGKLDVDANIETARRFGIRSIPSILFFKNGALVDKFVGSKSKVELQAKLDSLLS